VVKVIARSPWTGARSERNHPDRHTGYGDRVPQQRRPPRMERSSHHSHCAPGQSQCAQQFHNGGWNNDGFAKWPDWHAGVLYRSEKEKRRIPQRQDGK
jgi:hypothetical protein